MSVVEVCLPWLLLLGGGRDSKLAVMAIVAKHINE